MVNLVSRQLHLQSMKVNKIDRPNTTPTVRGICTLAIYFSVFWSFCCFTLACRFVEFDTSIICHALVHCFGSFLLQDMFLSLQVFAFNQGTNMTFTVIVLLTCILNCDASYD